MTTRYLIAVLSTLTLLSTSCETSKLNNKHPNSSAVATEREDSSELSDQRITQLIARAETARDRKLEKRPAFRAVESLEQAPTVNAPKDSDRLLLTEFLVDFSTTDGTEFPRPPYADVARYDRTANQIVYTLDQTKNERLELAIIASTVAAIDAQRFAEPAAPTSWDEQLTRAVAREATVLFSLASFLLDKNFPDSSIDVLANRPELVVQLPYLRDWIAFQNQGSAAAKPAAPAERFSVREQNFISREAWRLAAALYRSNGWSGVELAGAMPPARSVDVVRPDQWMSGAPVGQWAWPEDELKKDAKQQNSAPSRWGTVGPALISIWLEDVVDAQHAQSIFAGYLSDSYRYFEGSNTAESPPVQRFEWLTMWNSPSSASQVAVAFEKRLRERFKPREGVTKSPGRFSVFADGLLVGVIIEKGADTPKLREIRRTRAKYLLSAHTVELNPRQSLPTKFVPTRRDKLVSDTDASTLNERVWQGAASGLRMDLGNLGADWRVQKPDAGELRWFARHQDGAVLQLTVELDNPLGPTFESDAYRRKFSDAFRKTMQASTLEFVKTANPQTTGAINNPGLVLRVHGGIDTEQRTIQIWQFHRGDLLISYSLQSAPKSFAKHFKNAAAILASTTETHRSNPSEQPEAAAPQSEGSIEYKIED